MGPGKSIAYHKAYRPVSCEAKQLFSPFSRKSAGSATFRGGFYARNLRPKGSDEATCRRHLCGVSSEAGLSSAPLPPRGNKKTTEVWLSREGGAGGGAEARWGRKRSGVLQPVGQVELEFRRVGGREAASGKRKKTQAARGVSLGPGRGERWRRGRGRAVRPRDLEGLPLFAGPGASARGRRCHRSPGPPPPL